MSHASTPEDACSGHGSGSTSGRRSGRALIIAIGSRSRGPVTRSQMIEAGVSPSAITYGLTTGLLQSLHRGVYRVGPVPTPHEAETAALLACGEFAVLSHATAADLWGFGPARGTATPVEVSDQGGQRRSDRTMTVHRIAPLSPRELRTMHGLRVTAPARTLLDLAVRQPPPVVARALAAALRAGILDQGELDAQVTASPGRPGIKLLRHLTQQRGAPAFTRSEAEARFLSLVRKARLPEPATNVEVERMEVDFLWWQARLVVEVDGFAFHSTRSAFERDRRRDLLLSAAGYHVLRVTWRQLEREPEALLVSLTKALTRRSAGSRAG